MVYTANGEDLAALLVKNGLARIYGTRTPLPDGTDSRTYLARLAELEGQARAAGRGGFTAQESPPLKRETTRLPSRFVIHRSSLGNFDE